MEWQDIDSVPKGIEVLFYFPETAIAAEGIAVNYIDAYVSGVMQYPTHWMPLPKAPE